MNIFDRLRMPDIRSLRERYHELYGYWSGYHWETHGSIEDYKEELIREIAEKEKELAEKQKT